MERLLPGKPLQTEKLARLERLDRGVSVQFYIAKSANPLILLNMQPDTNLGVRSSNLFGRASFQ